MKWRAADNAARRQMWRGVRWRRRREIDGVTQGGRGEANRRVSISTPSPKSARLLAKLCMPSIKSIKAHLNIIDEKASVRKINGVSPLLLRRAQKIIIAPGIAGKPAECAHASNRLRNKSPLDVINGAKSLSSIRNNLLYRLSAQLMRRPNAAIMLGDCIYLNPAATVASRGVHF